MICGYSLPITPPSTSHEVRGEYPPSLVFLFKVMPKHARTEREYSFATRHGHLEVEGHKTEPRIYSIKATVGQHRYNTGSLVWGAFSFLTQFFYANIRNPPLKDIVGMWSWRVYNN